MLKLTETLELERISITNCYLWCRREKFLRIPSTAPKAPLHILSKVVILKYNIVLYNPQSWPQFYLTPHLGHTLESHRGHDFPSFLMGIYEESYLYHQREKTISTILFQMQDSKRSEGVFRVPRWVQSIPQEFSIISK